ncbi:MAG: hypothetical protein AAGI88_05685 [Pseudomonadota bacterium]
MSFSIPFDGSIVSSGTIPCSAFDPALDDIQFYVDARGDVFVAAPWLPPGDQYASVTTQLKLHS